MEASPTDKRIDGLSDRVGRFEGRFERFEDKVDARFDKVDRRFERFEDKVDERFDKIEARFDKFDARLASWGKIVGGGVVAAVGAIVSAVILKLFGV